MFVHPTKAVCYYKNIKKKLHQEIEKERNTLLKIKKLREEKKNRFHWIKHWGTGPVAYFFDYIDSNFQNDILLEFTILLRETQKFPQCIANYTDPFDFLNKLNTTKEKNHQILINIYKDFLKHYDTEIYSISINSVQIYQMFLKFNWKIEEINLKEQVKTFVEDFDINSDGRLNALEFLLGSIIYNMKNNFFFGGCTNCYSKISRKLGALFKYMDCHNEGFLSGEMMWDHLPLLNRVDKIRYNIFNFKFEENVRTNSISDFILKNEGVKKAYVTMKEFIRGILLGYWERHVTETHIVFDDSLNMKKLRWSEDGLEDSEAQLIAKNLVREDLKWRRQEDELRNMSDEEMEERLKCLLSNMKSSSISTLQTKKTGISSSKILNSRVKHTYASTGLNLKS